MATNMVVGLSCSFFLVLSFNLSFSIQYCDNQVILQLFMSVYIWGMRHSCAMMPTWSSGGWLYYHTDPGTQAQVIRLSSRHLYPWKTSHWPFNCQLAIL